MPFFTIHGMEVPVADKSWKADPLIVGERRARSVGAARIRTQIARKYRYTGKTPFLDPADAAWIVDLLNGEGDSWSFESNIYSAKGLLWSGTVPVRQNTNVKFGTWAGEAASGTTSTFSPGYAGLDKTVLFWRRPGAGAFDHYALTRTSGGTLTEYKNGVVGAYTTSNFFTFTDSTCSFLGKNDAGTNTTIQFDDVVVLPFLMPATNIATLAAQTAAWAPLPYLRVTGDGLDLRGGVTSRTVDPQEVDEEYRQGVSPTTNLFSTQLRAISFKLETI